MKNYFILLLLLALTSCSSFERMKYRHLNKVPATPQTFLVPEKLAHDIPEIRVAVESVIPESKYTAILTNDSVEKILQEVPPSCDSGVYKESGHIESVPSESETSKLQTPIRRDWSLLIGLLLLICGIWLLAFCITVLPFSGISIVWIIVMEIFFLYLAWRCIGTGTMYFLTRFRRKRKYGEK